MTGAGMPVDNWPDEGSLVRATFKWMSKGGMKVTEHEVYQLHRDSSGEIKVVNDKFWADYN